MAALGSISRIAAAVAGCLAMTTASAVPVSWTDWTTINQNTATGTMGGVTVSVSAQNNFGGPSQTACGTNWWTQPNASSLPYTGGTVSNAPTACEQVALNAQNSITVTFGSAVSNLYMALLSVGQPTFLVTYDFNQPFVIDSEGQGFWGNDATNGVAGNGDTLAMKEFHGVLRFSSPVTSLTFTTAPAEYWHAFTFGSAAAVPEPGTLALLGLGLLGIGASRRKKA